MDKYEYQLKLDQINKLIERNDYATAMKIADNIDWRRVRSVNTLCKIATIYEQNERYDDSIDLLRMAYDRSPVARTIAYRLADLSTRIEDYDQAISYYKEFVRSAPNDPAKLLLKYKIFRGKGAALKDQIAILEEYRTLEYEEEWALELAILYHEAGEIEKCVNECDELILWFNDGQNVLKAMQLKMLYAPLTPAQQEKYDIRMRKEKIVDTVEGVQGDERQAQRAAVAEEMYEQSYNNMYGDMYQQGYDSAYEDTFAQQQEEELPVIQEPEMVSQEDLYKVEEDGQMMLEMPQYQPVEKQITGQMTIEEILTEWEKVKHPVEETNEESEEKEEIQTQEEPEQEMKDEELPEIELPEIAMPDFGEEEEPAEEKIAEEETVEEQSEEAAEETIEEEAEEVIEESEEVAEEVTEEEAVEEDTVEETVPEEETVKEEPVEESADAMEEEELSEMELPEIELPEDLFAEEDESDTDSEEEMPQEEMPQEEQLFEEEELPEIAFPDFGEEEEPAEEEPQEWEDAADDLESRIVNSLSSDSVVLADANDGKIDGYIGESPIRKEERKRPVRRGLSEEEENIFTYFAPVRGMSDQLWTALDNERNCVRGGTSTVGNIIITGEPGTGKTSLAINLVKAIQKIREEGTGKVAKISAETLNEKDISAVVKKLHGGVLIVERAGELTSDTAVRLQMCMQGQTGELIFIFEDEKQPLRRFMKIHPKLSSMFTTKIDIPIFNNDELVEFGKSYAEELDYSIDEMAVLALYNRIGNMQRDDYDVSITDVKKIIDAAIENSEKGGIGKLFRVITKNRYDDDNRIILQEKDFERK